MLLIMLVIDTMVSAICASYPSRARCPRSISVTSASGHSSPSRLNSSASKLPFWVNIPSDSAISAAFARRTSLRPASQEISRSATCKSSGSICRPSRYVACVAISSASRIIARSARLSEASSFGSPPVIIILAEISISPRMSRFSSSSSPSRSGSECSSTLCRVCPSSTSLCASAKGGSVTPLPGLTLILFTESPRLSK